MPPKFSSIWMQTPREKVATIDGVNLFFGALLGANLGSLDALPINEYGKLIVLLAGLVMTIRIVSTSERRLYAVAMLLLYLALFSLVLFVPDMQPEGLAKADLHRLALTLGIWVGSVAIVEFIPTRAPSANPAGVAQGAPPP